MPSNRRSYGYIPEEEKYHKKNKSKKTKTIQKNSRQKLPSPQKKSNAAAIFFKTISFLASLFILTFRLILRGTAKIISFVFRSEKIRKNAIPLASLILVLGLLSTIIIIVWASKDLPDPNKLTDRQVAQSTKIYDRTGEQILYEIFSEEKRTLVTLDQIPKEVINGVIATEDTKFYEHKGVRPLSILRAFLYSFKNKRVAGTSTLTQQLVKNAILSRERKITRKIKEVILSIQLERKYSKDQILQIYFNEIPYGSTNYGIESAAQGYFGKTVSDLTLAESATLAGLPKAPSYYLNNHDALKERRNFVLGRMYAEGYIEEDVKIAAQKEPLEIDQKLGNIKAPHFVLGVRTYLIEKYGQQVVDTGGLKIITTLDWEKQQIAREIVEDQIGTETLAAAEANNAALISMDPKTGQILAMIGSKDYYDKEIKGEFNAATQAKRQPGSSFKPIIYTAAFEKGYTPNTILFDVKTNFSSSGRDYIPLNYDLQEHGPVTIRQSLQGSLNIPAVKALYLVGAKEGIKFSERLGYTTLSDGDFGLSLVLGGGGVRLIEHATAYSIIANEGRKVSPVSILRVEDNNGDVLEEWKQKKQEQVLEKNVALTTSDVLSDDVARSYAFGSDGILTIPGRQVAAKTGTTNSYIDAWTVGYTPNLVTAVWAGNTDNTPMKRGFGGSKVAGPIWNAYMKRALEKMPNETFTKPKRAETNKAVLNGSEGGSITLEVDKVTGKLATSSTPKKYIVKRTYTQPHSILHYVIKNNPQGPLPDDPTNDSQYTRWENSIMDWIKRKSEENPDWEISFEEPPTEFDDLHSLELIPTLQIIFPTPSSTLSSRTIDTDIRVSAPRGVTRVNYKIDGKQISSVKEHPFNLNKTVRSLTPGDHILTIIVEDDIGNRLEEEIPFTFDSSGAPATVSWQSNNQFITKKDFPRTFTLITDQPTKIEKTEIIIKNNNNDSEETLTTIDNFSQNSTVSVTWESPPSKGKYTLIAKTTRKDGSTINDTITVTIK